MKPTLHSFLTALGSKITSFKNLSALAVVLLLLSGGAWGQVTDLSQGFEGGVMPPTGWSNLNGGTGNTWGISTTSYSGTKAASYTYNITNAANAHLISSGVACSSGTVYTITFYTRSSSYAEKIGVKAGTTQSIAGMTLTLLAATTISSSSSTYYQISITWTAPSTATYYFDWNCTSAKNQNVLYVDDILITHPSPPCSGTPAPGNTIASVNPVAGGATTVLSTQNSTGSGATYQWQSSTDNSTWANVASAGTSATYTATPTAATYYRCNVTCSGNTGTSNSLLVNLSYCFPTGTSTTYYMTGFSTTGGISNITNTGTSYGTTNTGYSNYSSTISCSQYPNSAVNFAVALAGNSTTNTYSYGVSIWVDWNNNFTFDVGEKMYNSAAYVYSASGSFTVPAGTAAGSYRMRVLTDYDATSPVACSYTSSNGEAEDYTFTVVAIPSCSGTPTAGTISTANQTLLSGATPSNIVVTGFSGDAGITLQWQESTDNTTWTTVIGGSGATTATYTPPTFAGTTIYYRCNVTCTNSSLSAATTSVSINPCPTFASTISINGLTAVSGTSYPTLTAAISSLAICGITQPTILELTSNYNSSAETFPITISAISGASATNTLTIKPASGVTASISGSSASSIFKLNGADYVTIDGSNSGGSDKSLSISNTNTGISSAIVWVASASASNGATNNTIKNCNIAGNASTTTYCGIVSSSGTTITNPADAANVNNTYTNNTLNTSWNGIALLGVVGNEANNTITNNNIGSTTTNNKIGCTGIYVSNQANFNVSNNTVFGVSFSGANFITGISINGTISGGTVSKNKISDIKNPSSTGYPAYGINLNSTSILANVTLSNNFIFDIAGYGNATTREYNGHGIVIYAGGGYSIYNNTVNMNTSQSVAARASALFVQSGLTTSNSGNINIINNIFSNTQTTNATSSVAIYSSSINTIYSSINYNNYFCLNTIIGGYYNSTGGLSTTTSFTSLMTNLGSTVGNLNVLPSFTSATDLHLTTSGNCSLNNAGTPISGITTDYDGATRSTTTPDIGADEFTGDINTAGAASSTPTLCNNTILTNITHATTVATGIGTATGLPTGVTAAWASDTITISGTPSATGTFNYTIPLSGGTCSVNATGTITVNPLPTALVLTGSLTCAGTTGSITSSTSVIGVEYQLYNSSNAPVGAALSGTGSGLTWSSIAIGNGYYVKATNTSTTCVSANSNAVNVGTITTKTWLGTTDTSWNTASNWSCGTLPSSSDVIVISSGSPVLDTNFTVGSGGSLTISGSGTLTISPTSTLTVTGTANFGGNSVTIKSDSNGTGAIGQVTGTLSNATNVTVERYIPNRRAWRALTAPLKGSNSSVFSQWQNNGNSTLTGVGVELWGPGGTGSTGNGLAVGPNNSILQYDNSVAGAWTPVTDTKSTNLFTIGANNAFMLFPTGGYGSGNIFSSANATATTLKATGQLITGPVTYTSLPSASHTLIGNPYASPIDLNSILDASTTLQKYFWVWDPNGANQGAYNTFDALANTFTFTDLSYSNSTVIQSGQAFFVKALTGQTGSFTINENNKSNATVTNVFRNGTTPELFRVGLYKQENNLWSGRDGAMTVILSDADANQAQNKLANGTENIAFVKNGTLFASEHHLPLVASDVLNIRVWKTTAGSNYKLKINTEQFAITNLDATLEDLFTNSRTPLNLDGTAVEYPFTVTTDALSTGDRFRIVFQTSLLGSTLPTASGFSIIPNPVTGDSFQVNLGTLATGTYTYSIYNAIGQEVEKGSINNAAQNTNNTVKFRESAATGIYIMKIKGSDNSVFTAKIIKK